MSNTIGTILRAFWIMAYLVAGWFLAVTAVYGLAAAALGVTFSWAHAGIFFGALVLVRIAYPRNVFAR